eukprot:Colp12_sorted_trinity150504_noHs@14486
MRRQWLLIMVAVCITASIAAEQRLFGTTFSHHELKNRNVDWRQAMNALGELGFNTLRIGVYWSDSEPVQGQYDFKEVDEVLAAAKAVNITNVLLTVGSKAPRYPEFYIPEWALPEFSKDAEISKNGELRWHIKNFVEAAVQHFEGNDIVKAWQVENEPMDRSGENHWFIGADFMSELVSAVRGLDTKNRTIVVNCWCDDQIWSSAPWFDKDYAFRNALSMADVVGLDIYPRVGREQTFWERRTITLPTEYIARAHEAKKTAWVIESQAEPWDPATYDAGAIQWLVDRHIEQGFRSVFLWGFEWWYQSKLNGDLSVWDHVKWESYRFLTLE